MSEIATIDKIINLELMTKAIENIPKMTEQMKHIKIKMEEYRKYITEELFPSKKNEIKVIMKIITIIKGVEIILFV